MTEILEIFAQLKPERHDQAMEQVSLEYIESPDASRTFRALFLRYTQDFWRSSVKSKASKSLDEDEAGPGNTGTVEFFERFFAVITENLSSSSYGYVERLSVRGCSRDSNASILVDISL